MEEMELNDGFFRSINYDETSRQLYVKLESGEHIMYYEVAKLDYVGLISSHRMKDFYVDKIKPRFPSKLITK